MNTKLIEAIEDFETQYNCVLEPTGYELAAEENSDVEEVEYWVRGLVQSPLDFAVSGWFSADVRTGQVYCLLDLSLDGESLGETKAILGEYDHRSGWDLRWDKY